MRGITNFIFLMTCCLAASFLDLKPWQQKHPKQEQPKFKWLHFKYCHDGDTCQASSANGLHYKLRLLGIDAPELGTKNGPAQSGALVARDHLNSLIKNKVLLTKFLGGDIYGRHLVLIYDKNLTINEHLIQEGHAFSFQGKNKPTSLEQRYQRLEREAKLNKKGFWKNSITPLRPNIWRQKAKEHHTNPFDSEY